MKRRSNLWHTAWELAPGLILIAALLAILDIAMRNEAFNRGIVPQPSLVIAQFLDILTSGAFIAPAIQTFGLLLIGFFVGSCLAILLGTLMGFFRPVYNLFEPLVEVMRPMPKSALLPVLMLLVGLNSTMKITIVALACFFPVLINTIQGVRSIEPMQVDMARTFGYSRAAQLRKIVLPSTLPYIFAGMRIGLGFSLITIVIAEMLSGTGGLGDNILQAQTNFLVTPSFAWLTVLSIGGILLTVAFASIEKRLTFWNAPEQS